MDRRGFVVSGCTLVLSALAPRGMAANTRTIGLLWVSSPGSDRLLRVFRDSLKARGFDESALRLEHDVHVDRYEALEAAMQRLLQRGVDVVVAYGMTAATTAAHATSQVPVVFLVTNDPVEAKLVATLGRPGRNVTGLRLSPNDQTGKRFEFLKRIAPSARRIGHLLNESSVAETAVVPHMLSMGKAVGLEVEIVGVRVASDIQPAIAAAAKAGIQAFAVSGSTMLVANARKVVDAIAGTRLPAVYPNSDYTDVGGIVSYGPNLTAAFTRAGEYVARILKGAKPADLPVEQSDVYELVVNARAARSLGITIPRDVLGLADRIIGQTT